MGSALWESSVVGCWGREEPFVVTGEGGRICGPGPVARKGEGLVRNLLRRCSVRSTRSVRSTLGSLLSKAVRSVLRARVSSRLNCSHCRESNRPGCHGNVGSGAIHDGCNRFRMSIPRSHRDSFRPRVLPGHRGSVSSVSSGVVSVCTGKVAAQRVSRAVRSVCNFRMDRKVMSSVASGLLPQVRR